MKELSMNINRYQLTRNIVKALAMAWHSKGLSNETVLSIKNENQVSEGQPTCWKFQERSG